MAAFAARTVLRSATTPTRTAAAKVATGAKSKATGSAFRIPAQKPLSARIFRSPVEMGCVSVGSMLPYHTATASALLNSMLSVSPRSYGWILEVVRKLSVSFIKATVVQKVVHRTGCDYCSWADFRLEDSHIAFEFNPC
ncbi:hypothetical protein ACH5RR_015159 [Cinchona calisaya]|uniref:Protein NUCLEAR FUSION DEFECTIVE 6, chloroplastic/mitochondrial-like n=1 Tax=Cinchona calisaya TaxID=153742 RepID=A0ABD2ZVG4_9GENT